VEFSIIVFTVAPDCAPVFPKKLPIHSFQPAAAESLAH
jgi:hypothetical protein